MPSNGVALAVYERDGRRCGICGEPVALEQLQIDHIVPRYKGGADDPANLRATHRACNQRRGRKQRTVAATYPAGQLHRPQINVRLDPYTASLMQACQQWLNATPSATFRAAIAALARALSITVPEHPMTDDDDEE